MRSITKCFISFATVSALMLLAAGAQATDRYVATTGLDTNPGTAALPWKTIQRGIDATVNGDVLHVAAGTYTQSLTWTGLDAIDDPKDITIQGAGEGLSIIEGSPTASALTTDSVSSASSISGFTIQNGHSRYGGGIFNNTSDLTISNCTFSNNQSPEILNADYGGGALCNGGGSPHITNCTFSGNSTLGRGGVGGAVYNVFSNATFTGCSFLNNSTPDTSGGGGAMMCVEGNVTIQNCSFTANQGNYQGGAIYSYLCNINVIDSTFSGNSAYYAGAISIYGAGSGAGSQSVTGCTFQNQTGSIGGAMMIRAASPKISKCAFVSNSAVSVGGGICITTDVGPSAPVISNCQFVGNNAVENGGGGIFSSSSGMTVACCTFQSNSSFGGGGIAIYGTNSASIANCTFVGNVATATQLFSGAGGGAIYSSDGITPITNCIVWGNQTGFGRAGIFTLNPSPMYITNTLCQDFQNVAPDPNGNFAANPLFVDAANGDLRLSPLSPCIDKGRTDAVVSPPFLMDPTNTFIIDLAGIPRINGDSVDQGAYEFQNTVPVAGNDAYTTNEETPLTIAAPGVLANDSDADGQPLTVKLKTGPAFGQVTLSQNGSFTYTPDSNFFGSDSFTYTLSDGLSKSQGTVNLTVNAVNDAPEANGQSVGTDEDTPLSGTLQGSDPDGDFLTFTKASNPSHGSVIVNTDGTFTYTPTANFNGSDSFMFTVNDGALSSNAATVNITVNAVNDAPNAANDSYSTNQDTTLNVGAPGVLSNDSDVDGGSLTAIQVTGPAHGTLTLNADGSFAYTPNAGYSGPDSFTYRANDGTADSGAATVNITVNPVNHAPVANGDSYSTNSGVNLNVAAPGVLGNDTDADGNALTAAVVTGPAHGTLTLNANGSFTYKPAVAYVGPDSFTYRASDGTSNSNTATVNLTVNGTAGQLVIEGVTLKKVGGSTQVSLKIRNTGGVTATNVVITVANLDGAVSKPAVPISEKNVVGNSSISEMLTFKVGSGTRLLTIAGTSSLGSFSYSATVQAP